MSDIPLGRVYVGSLDDEGLGISAQYNPKELQIDMTVPWQKHQKPNTSGLQYEFTGAEGRTMSIDLLFDGFEQNASIADSVDILNTLATVRDPTSSDPEMRRPHHCVAIWGTVMGGDDNRFKCVITQISSKYTMFSSDGNPLRATVTLKLQEATRVTMAAGGGSDGGGSDGGGGDGGGGDGGGGDGGGGDGGGE